MKIFFDEDTGKGVPLALRYVGVKNVEYVSERRGAFIKKGSPDEEWIPWAGKNNFLVFSCNKRILEVEAQRSLVIEEKLGAVFLTSGQETKLELLKLVLNQWGWLERIWQEEPRPFAFYISIRGRKRRADLSRS